MGSDVLARVRAEIDARLLKLSAAVAEYERLLDAERALAADAAAAAAEADRPAKVARPAKTVRPAKAAASREEKQDKPEEVQQRQATRVVAPTRPKRTSATAPARRGRRGSAAGAIKQAASSPHDASQQAIVAALEHGSHTLSELVLVTAIAASELRQGVRHLQHAGTITRTKREGRAAYALASASTG